MTFEHKNFGAPLWPRPVGTRGGMTLGEHIHHNAFVAATIGARSQSPWRPEKQVPKLARRAAAQEQAGIDHFAQWSKNRARRDREQRRRKREQERHEQEQERRREHQAEKQNAFAFNRWKRQKDGMLSIEHTLPGHRNPALGFELPYCYHPESFGSAFSDPRYVSAPPGVGNCAVPRNGRVLRQAQDGKWHVVPSSSIKNAAMELLNRMQPLPAIER